MRSVVLIIVLLFSILPVLAVESTSPHAPSNQYRVWLRTFGNWTQGDDETTGTAQFSSYGLTLGVDRQFGKKWLAGLALGENKTTIEWGNSRFEGDITAWHADLYARRTFEQFFLDLEGNFGFNELSYQDDASQWGISGEVGTWWNHGLGKTEPYFRLSHVCWDGTGNETKETLIAGLRYSWRTTTDLTTTVPRFYGGLIQELGRQSLFSVSSFGNTPTVFPIGNGEIPDTRFFLGGGFTTTMGTSLDILFRYTAEMSSQDTSHTILLGVNCNF